jgi:hypothetical protein
MVAMRQVEKKIVRKVIKDALAAGYALTVHNGGDTVLEPSTNASEILETMFATDDEYLVYYKEGKRVGWVYFVYGNDGWDVVCDHTTNLEEVMQGATLLADKYS